MTTDDAGPNRAAAPGFGPAEEANARALIDLALAEDLGPAGDITAAATIPAAARGRAAFVARVPGVLCGMEVAELLAGRLGLDRQAEGACLASPAVGRPFFPWDGARLERGQPIAVVAGPMRALLAFERTALNFLQRLSGIATETARYVAAAGAGPAAIFDTRKTTPGWRALEKYAVRCGGGRNHRAGLHDAVLIKDNHLAFLAEGGDPIGRAVAAARAARLDPPPAFVEVEVDSLEQLDRALECGPDIVLLDNFALGELAEAVRRRNARAPGVQLEASGGITLESIAAIARTGVERISVGALTHSAPALDIALDYLA